MALYALPLKKHQQQPWHSVQKTCFVSVILDFTDSQEEYHYSTSHIVEKIALIFPQIMTIIITYAIVAVDVSLRWLCCHVTKYFYLHSGLLITTRLLGVLYVPHSLILHTYVHRTLIIFCLCLYYKYTAGLCQSYVLYYNTFTKSFAIFLRKIYLDYLYSHTNLMHRTHKSQV